MRWPPGAHRPRRSERAGTAHGGATTAVERRSHRTVGRQDAGAVSDPFWNACEQVPAEHDAAAVGHPSEPAEPPRAQYASRSGPLTRNVPAADEYTDPPANI